MFSTVDGNYHINSKRLLTEDGDFPTNVGNRSPLVDNDTGIKMIFQMDSLQRYLDSFGSSYRLFYSK